MSWPPEVTATQTLPKSTNLEVVSLAATGSTSMASDNDDDDFDLAELLSSPTD